MNINDLEGKALWVRQRLWEMTMKAGRGHLPSCYSCVEIIVALYYGGVIHVPLSESKLGLCYPDHPDRDRVIISKGHGSAVLYPVLADFGFFPMEELDRYCEPDALLGMYADPSVPGVEALSDSLGHGLGIGCGMALAAKRNGLDYKTYVIMGDAECDEGSVWESASFAAHYGLDNLFAIVDLNNLGILGRPLAITGLGRKWDAFGWRGVHVNGHDVSAVEVALRGATTPGVPLVVFAHTVKGKGISFMEDKPEWHNKIPDEDLQAVGRRELELE